MFGWLFGKPPIPAERKEPTIEASSVAVTSSTGRWEDLFGPRVSVALSPDVAMRHATVWRCVSLISGIGAAIPIHTYHEDPDGSRSPTDSHAAARLLALRPNPRMSRSVFWRRIYSQMLFRGNGYAWIERRLNGQPMALWPVPYERCSVDLMSDGSARYRMWLDDMTEIVAHQDDVLHFPGSSVWDMQGLRCKTPMQAMAATVAIGLSADKYAQAYFDNDATPPIYISYPNKFQSGPKQGEDIRDYWKRQFGGENRHSGPAVLDQGGEVKQLDISAEDAQLLETRRFSVEDIGRIFGVPRFLLGMDETSWGSGIEALGIGFVTYTMDPHFVAIQDECNWKLFGTSKTFCEYDRDALIRGDIKARAEADRLALGGSAGPGWATQNDIRRSRNMRPVPNGDKLTDWAAVKPPASDIPADPAAPKAPPK
jgi:HK97 family phage portal protein